jgi:hypothetical protein
MIVALGPKIILFVAVREDQAAARSYFGPSDAFLIGP